MNVSKLFQIISYYSALLTVVTFSFLPSPRFALIFYLLIKSIGGYLSFLRSSVLSQIITHGSSTNDEHSLRVELAQRRRYQWGTAACAHRPWVYFDPFSSYIQTVFLKCANSNRQNKDEIFYYSLQLLKCLPPYPILVMPMSEFTGPVLVSRLSWN